jgi:hypothetical protein
VPTGVGVALGVEKVKDAVGMGMGTVTVEATESDIATTTGVEAVSVGAMVERGNVMLGTNDVGGTVLVAATEEVDIDLTESGIAGDPGMSDLKSNDTMGVLVKLPTIQSRPRLYPFRTISCPNSIGSSTDALAEYSVNQNSSSGTEVRLTP